MTINVQGYALLALFLGSSYVYYKGAEESKWTICFYSWFFAQFSLMGLWASRVHVALRILVALAVSVISGYGIYINPSGSFLVICVALSGAILLTCYDHVLADVFWQAKVIFLDLLTCFFGIVVLGCWDVYAGTRSMLALLSYFCGANLYGIGTMKVAEVLWDSRALSERLPMEPAVSFVHNLKAPVSVLERFWSPLLLLVSWAMMMHLAHTMLVLWNQAAPWQAFFASGACSTLVFYLMPIVTQPRPGRQHQH